MGEFLFALMFDLIVFGPVVVTACYNVLFESKDSSLDSSTLHYTHLIKHRADVEAVQRAAVDCRSTVFFYSVSVRELSSSRELYRKANQTSQTILVSSGVHILPPSVSSAVRADHLQSCHRKWICNNKSGCPLRKSYCI